MNVTLTLICYKNGDFTAKMVVFQEKKVTLQQKQVAPQTYLMTDDGIIAILFCMCKRADFLCLWHR